MIGRVLYYIAFAITIVLHPVWLTTYAICFYTFSSLQSLHPNSALQFLTITFIMTACLPLLSTRIFVKCRKIDDMSLTQKEQRNIPIVFCIAWYSLWLIIISCKFTLPNTILSFAFTTIIALAVLLILNQAIKVSVHLFALGCMLGVFTSMLLHAFLPFTSQVIFFVLGYLFAAGCVMWSRLYLKAHTFIELVVAFVMGAVCFIFSPIAIYD